MSEIKPVLSMHNIGKSFSGNQVLNNVSFDIMPGEIYAICGENGAGKSTLMNILFGMPVITNTGGFNGKILIDGKETQILNPVDAIGKGIGMVHQEFLLIPGFTVGENIKLNREPLKPSAFSKVFGTKLMNVDFDTINRDARNALDKLEIDLDEMLPIESLPVGYMQFVEIAREIDKENIKILILDEPTAVLTESEAEIVMKAIKKLSGMGIAVLLITHRIDEIMQVADTVTILRDGINVKTKKIADTSAVEIAQLMVGRELQIVQTGKNAKVENQDVALSIKNLKVNMQGEKVDGLDLDLYKGEILGIGGLAGQGKLGIANGIMGIYPTSGEITVGKKALKLNSPKDSIAAKLSFVSEDRRKQGFLPDGSIEMNMTIPSMINHDKYFRMIGPFRQVDQKKISSVAKRYIDEFQIRCTGSKQPVKSLSGGNQQKVCIAKALLLEPEILLVSEPTRGIDIGAKNIILNTITNINKETGVTVLFTSSELAELRQICDRIAIISDGKLVSILSPDAPDEEFGLAMSGKKKEADTWSK